MLVYHQNVSITHVSEIKVLKHIIKMIVYTIALSQTELEVDKSGYSTQITQLENPISLHVTARQEKPSFQLPVSTLQVVKR